MALSDNTRGALLMMGCMSAFTFNDACMKSLADDLPLFQALFLRGVATTLLLMGAAHAMGVLRFDLSPRDWRFVGLRTLAEVGAAYFFLTALFHAPIANVTAIIQALPLTVTLAAAVFLGEAVGWRRMIAIIVGLLGVLLIVRPGTEGFNVYSLYALTAVACVTLRDLATRCLSQAVPSLAVALGAAIGVTAFAGAGALSEPWVEVPAKAGFQLAGAAVFVLAGYLLSVMAMRRGDLAFIAPFRYTALLWALLLGFVLFDEWPAPATLIGSAIVVATGIFTFYRERKLVQAGPVPLRMR